MRGLYGMDNRKADELSKRQDKLVICTGKHGFASRFDAERAMKSKRLRRGGKAYLCPFCSHWHVGSKPPKRKG